MSNKGSSRFVTTLSEGQAFYLYSGTPRERKCVVDQARVNGTVVVLLEGPIDEKFQIQSGRKAEIMPGIFVEAVGWKGDHKASIAIEAPRSVKISKDPDET